MPEGLPSFALPRNGFNDASDIGDIISACVPVALVAFMSQWTVARKYAEMRQEELDPNQEAFALGEQRRSTFSRTREASCVHLMSLDCISAFAVRGRWGVGRGSKSRPAQSFTPPSFVGYGGALQV